MNGNPEKTRRRLLLADDSVTIRKVVELTFAEEGIDVISASDGDMAMQKFVEQTPDIVLVDVEMPGSSGYQICEMIKADESTRHIPVLLLVGSFEPFDQTQAERAQADGFLTKPFHSIRELVSKVNELLGEEPTEVPIPETHDIDQLYSSSFSSDQASSDDHPDEGLTTASFEGTPDEEDLQFRHDIAGPSDDLGDASFDDGLVETMRPSADHSDNGHITISNAPTIEARVEDFDWSPAGVVATEEKPDQFEAVSAVPHAESSIEGVSTEADVPIEDSKAETVEMASPFAEDVPAAEQPNGQTSEATHFEPPDELIERIAQRVIDRLSDRAVRDIAQEAVPRIAEKLIREALEEESKS